MVVKTMRKEHMGYNETMKMYGITARGALGGERGKGFAQERPAFPFQTEKRVLKLIFQEKSGQLRADSTARQAASLSAEIR